MPNTSATVDSEVYNLDLNSLTSHILNNLNLVQTTSDFCT